MDYKKLMSEGAIIVDVRTKQEFNSGHIKGSINIPLDVLGNNLKKLDKNKSVITCCASGMRSASAKGILKSKGYTAFNGGGWNGLERKLVK
ncbi:MAG: rhodanese-like domain-containing protein [Chitinophagales bacterium]|nr:rhodanese-like domain-containing protein [Chitinophagales bacterium]MBP9704185.1 rhodanese-like domain-containing protein [Chitinophagales bacterium]